MVDEDNCRPEAFNLSKETDFPGFAGRKQMLAAAASCSASSS